MSSSSAKEPFGSLNPFAEPPWYNSVNSPYYKSSHRRLRAFIRAYVDEYIIPNCEEWENQGYIPKEVSSLMGEHTNYRPMNDMQKWDLWRLYSLLQLNICLTSSYPLISPPLVAPLRVAG
jgi:hypothetical protein